MDVEEILAELDRNHTQVPRITLEEAAAHREEIIPRLLAVLEEVAKDPAPFAEDKNRNIHIYAMYLLAQFRETRAYPLLVKIFSVPGEVPFDLAGTVVTQDLASILASVSDGDPSGMMELVENEKANEYVRGAAMDGLVTLMAFGKRKPGRGDGIFPPPVPNSGAKTQRGVGWSGQRLRRSLPNGSRRGPSPGIRRRSGRSWVNWLGRG